MGGLYHQHRVEQGSGVCPSCCTSRAYSLCEVPPGSEKAEFCPKEPPEMCIDVMMFFFFGWLDSFSYTSRIARTVLCHLFVVITFQGENQV